MISAARLETQLYDFPRWLSQSCPGHPDRPGPSEPVDAPVCNLLLDPGVNTGLLRLVDSHGHALSGTYYRSAQRLMREWNDVGDPLFWQEYHYADGDEYREEFDIDLSDLAPTLRRIESTHDAILLGRPRSRWLAKRLESAFRKCLSVPGMPWESGGSLTGPLGSYIQWTSVDLPGSPLHLEVFEGGDFSQPMPGHERELFEYLGWNAPEDEFRNAWLRAESPEELRAAAGLVIRTLASALNVPSKDLDWRHLAS